MKNIKGDPLEKREIRTHYSGVIIFAAKLITVATGIVFALIVANSLPQTEYGILGIFNLMVPYFTILSGAVSFWTMRFVARSAEGATKTGLVANAALAAIATLIYLALLPIVAPAFGLNNYIIVYLIMAMQVVEIYLITVLESSLQGRQPEFIGLGLLIGEALKVVFCYLFVVNRQMGLLGVALSITAAYAIKVGFYFKIVFSELKQKLRFSYIREWVKGSAFNVYSIIGDRIAAILFLLIGWYGTEIATSYYYATSQIANIIGYSTFLAFALTPKLLAENKIEEATVSLKFVLMFAIPMAAGVLALPGSYMIFLKESGEYVAAVPVLMILAIDALISTVSSVFTSVLYGVERVDEKATIRFREMIKSKIFIAFSFPYIHAAITLPAAFYALTVFAHGDPLQVAIYATGINLIGHVVMFFVLSYVLRKAAKLKIPWSNIGKYALSSVVMAAILLLTHPSGRLSTLIFTAIGGVAYITILLAIDRDTRTLLRNSVDTVKTRVSRRQRIENETTAV